MLRRAYVAIVACCAMACHASSPVPVTMTHDAYIWQRLWTPALDRAALDSAAHIAAWRVLAIEIDARGRVIESVPHLDVLARTGKPVTPVIRISGQIVDWNPAAQADIIQRGLALIQRWRDAGVVVSGIEIDHDCGTASLRQYAAFLRDFRLVRQARPRDAAIPLPLSITALPAWLDSDFLAEVLRHVDQTVLQVHAVQHPSQGLFDADRARAWAAAWSRVSAVPFRIALPTYGSRVTWTPAGRIIAIASEAPTLGDPTDSRELFATPREIAGFIDSIRRDRPSHFVGFAWFRLPTDEDARAWSLDTWHAVIDGRPLVADISAVVERHATIPGLYNVFLKNLGEVEDAVPAAVTITGTCEAADAIAPYAMEKHRQDIEFKRVTPRLLALHRQTLIGWVRCSGGEVQVHAHS
jgi:hypothetical protein